MEQTVVLIVEDHPTKQDLYRRLLAGYSVHILWAETQASARQLFGQHREVITHVIMDGMVPAGAGAVEPEGRPNTLELVREFNGDSEHGYAGIWIAASADSDYNRTLTAVMSQGARGPEVRAYYTTEPLPHLLELLELLDLASQAA